jgi:tRNA U34 5-methylaminomethyl-2-thiouridine-forming methyltransferase MnmC
MKVKIIQTEDKSMSVFNTSFNESYHSVFGAVRESQTVFIEHGLRLLLNSREKINILEFGFGTGLNALLTLKEAENRSVFYKSLELYPLDMIIVNDLNYTSIEEFKYLKGEFLKMHSAVWNTDVPVTEKFILHKEMLDFIEFETENSFYDLIYFDAFSPETQPELWSEEIFKKLFESLKPDGLLVTYSAKGSVKRALRNAGFFVERLKGPPGKRHVLRALRLP